MSTIMRALTNKVCDSLCHLDNLNESEAEIKYISLKHLLLNNQGMPANKGEIKGQLPHEHVLRFCKTFKKLTKQLEFHSTFKTANSQDIIYTTLAYYIKVFFNNLFLFLPILNPDAHTINVECFK